MMFRIVVLASGSGSNALNLIQYFNGNGNAEVVLIASNRAQAPVLEKASSEGVDTYVFTREAFYNSDIAINKILSYQPDLVVLAGFLWLIPSEFIQAFEGKMINLHPSLLPKFGGKGMYGDNVHKAVLAAKESQTGITIHMVNAEYDKGEVVYTDQFDVLDADDLSSIQTKIHNLEKKGLPKAIEELMIKWGYEVLDNNKRH